MNPTAAPFRGQLRTVGHAAATRLVTRAIVDERPPHALLLAGPRGVGKTTLALDLAAGLLCLAPDPIDRPCRACGACRKVEHDNHPDLHRLAPDGAGEQIRIGAVAQLIGDLALLAMEARFRVAVLEAAQRMNPDAQNALLKTLEEPGPATCIVLCADDLAPILPTVISRSARARLAPLPIEVLTRMLLDGGLAAGAPARALAITAAGRPGLAIRLAGQPEAAIARARLGRTLLGLATRDRRTRLSEAGELIEDGALIDAGLLGQPPTSSRRLQPTERRRAVTIVLEAWRDVARDLAMVAGGSRQAVRDDDLLEDIEQMTGAVDGARLATFMDRLDALVVAIEAYASPELVLDALLLDWSAVMARRAQVA